MTSGAPTSASAHRGPSYSSGRHATYDGVQSTYNANAGAQYASNESLAQYSLGMPYRTDTQHSLGTQYSTGSQYSLGTQNNLGTPYMDGNQYNAAESQYTAGNHYYNPTPTSSIPYNPEWDSGQGASNWATEEHLVSLMNRFNN
ncbi:hypothetical protein M422DRAFT_49662 [Sphaerobolus stellatus SS14]|uniref:Uncharacterized protein n=1 Tax=Sphaerobolus stellatus (strain SS14) TaxID=990650 RepID=A0A0C9U893_SPHS4|nr:hypothetical protein M422DRAFT_52671 [Sphaerobolus stellatus SS14]KIJ39248.1 hypothetical protein M422DRAFT_49662 [Sphaerobolus stellatus SS14]